MLLQCDVCTSNECMVGMTGSMQFLIIDCPYIMHVCMCYFHTADTLCSRFSFRTLSCFITVGDPVLLLPWRHVNVGSCVSQGCMSNSVNLSNIFLNHCHRFHVLMWQTKTQPNFSLILSRFFISISIWQNTSQIILNELLSNKTNVNSWLQSETKLACIANQCSITQAVFIITSPHASHMISHACVALRPFNWIVTTTE